MAVGCAPCGNRNATYDPWRPKGDPARAGNATVYNPQPKGRKVVYEVVSKFGTQEFADRTTADLSAGQTGGRVSMKYVQE